MQTVFQKSLKLLQPNRQTVMSPRDNRWPNRPVPPPASVNLGTSFLHAQSVMPETEIHFSRGVSLVRAKDLEVCRIACGHRKVRELDGRACAYASAALSRASPPLELRASKMPTRRHKRRPKARNFWALLRTAASHAHFPVSKLPFANCVAGALCSNGA